MDFTIAFIPDQQNETLHYPAVWESEVNWIVANEAALNIQLVIGVGDHTDGRTPAERVEAKAGWDIIKASGVPYLPIIGNHDYDNTWVRDVVSWTADYGVSYFAGKSWFGGTYLGSTENYWAKLTLYGTTYLFLALELYPRTAVINWAKGVIAANPGCTNIVITHAYMHANGALILAADSGGTYCNDQQDAQYLWDNFIKTQGISLVLCGHAGPTPTSALRQDAGTDGKLVTQLYLNHQYEANGGNGYLGLLTMTPQLAEIRTYSPYLGLYDSSGAYILSNTTEEQTMAKTLSGVVAAVRSLILDDVAEGTTNDFTDELIQTHIDQALAEVSEKAPAESKETLTTTANSNDITLAVDGLIEVVKAEYPTGNKPPSFRNVSLWGTVLTLDLDTPPTSAATCYAWCRKLHTLTETTSTLRPNQERVLIDGAAAYTALSYAHTARTQITAAKTAVALADSISTQASAQISGAISDLGSVSTAAGSASTRISAAIADLVLQDAAADAMSTLITTAQADLVSARSNLTSKVGMAETVLGDIALRLSQAISDLDDSRGYIDAVPIMGAPQVDYSRTASGELNNVSAILARARSYLSEISAAGHYEAIAAREQGNASIDSGQASQYGAMAARELQAGALYLSQASQYSGKAARELQAASTYLSQAGNALRSASSRLNISQAINSALRWGEQKLAYYKRELNSLQKPQTFQTYPSA